MTTMADQRTYAEIVTQAIDRAGGIRPLSRLLFAHGERVSPSQISNLRDGFSPFDLRVTRGLSRLYLDLEAQLYNAMGLPPAPPAAIPGAVPLALSDARLPLGPPVSAMRGHDLGDVETHDEVGVSREWIEAGATMAATVTGECLAPDLLPGDFVALRPQDHAAHGQIVLVRLEDGAFTLKRFAENGGPHLTTNDPRRFPPPPGRFEIVAVVVGSWRNHR